ncbi:hypothetical protein P152DRAFT_462310 [Eremomyces bilateralis CBS 781.70]|uniref:Uncharacterized protein n=1 Tax=Eremomyces bilateralis CBS 781.70 TaxID=1392243 RepID=A0A6G1FRW1_9PEZI|nr:uncharacterized protein P152DRAFT_462310 [Eremomyces bilateralis CBS 781.70]KAF1808585.1 hypothetical protein P152DRAFT_462310 [Eremomyces bilateralis CBS 781.70]
MDEMTDDMNNTSIGGLEIPGLDAWEPQVRPESMSDESAGVVSARADRTVGALKTKEVIWNMISNKALSQAETTNMLSSLAKADTAVRKTFATGLGPLDKVYPSVPVLAVRLTFLPGADKPQVNRLEQVGMVAGEPDQRTPLWRVMTAGSLLQDFEIKQDLSIVFKDRVSQYAGEARSRLQSNRSPYGLGSTMTGVVEIEGKTYEAVTIDSDHVKIVNNLRAQRYPCDMEATLIEVDGTSLMALMTNYRHLINKGGPEMDFEESEKLLDGMIEDARRVIYRSPILFRASTRQQIIASRNTRYGVNHDQVFQTLTTSEGIREILSLSASYYNSLDPEDTNTRVQKFIRPRFLQMIVLLISLLNETDTQKIARFLEQTYKLKADRPSLELLVLKVMPLISINSQVFLTAIVPAVEGFPLTDTRPEYQSWYWDFFVKQMLKRGYFLPGTVATLGRQQSSWLVKWPKGGFNTSLVFNNLQFSGDLRTGNDIPALELHPEQGQSELTVIMTNGDTYIVAASDVERITSLQTGQYPLREPGDNGRTMTMEVRDESLNEEEFEALYIANVLVENFNRHIVSVRRSTSSRLTNLVRYRGVGRAPKDTSGLQALATTGRLTRHTATLNGIKLAVAYKLNGRKINKHQVSRLMQRKNSEILGIRNYYSVRVEKRIISLERQYEDDFWRAVRNIQGFLTQAESKRKDVEDSDLLSDEPISQVIYPGANGKVASNVWFEYEVEPYVNGPLKMHARRSQVISCAWLAHNVIEVGLQNDPNRYFVSPLKFVEEGDRNDEIQVEDHAILAGQYMIIAEGNDNLRVIGNLIMTNCLRIISVEEVNRTRRGANRQGRGANRAATGESLTACVFV